VPYRAGHSHSSRSNNYLRAALSQSLDLKCHLRHSETKLQNVLERLVDGFRKHVKSALTVNEARLALSSRKFQVQTALFTNLALASARVLFNEAAQPRTLTTKISGSSTISPEV
jgi:hypothetical protein